MHKKQFEEFFKNLLDIEIKSVAEVLKGADQDVKEKKASAADLEFYKTITQSYIKGLQRAVELIATAMEQIKE